MDFATSSSPAVQRQLDRLGALSVPDGRFGLDTVRELLKRLGDPQERLAPVFHVAGTNGKGSTCAFLRAMLEADGKRVHVTTSPHLVRYNERIRIAGQIISDTRLAEVLAEVLDAGQGLDSSFFEVTIAAAFLEFARVPADACVIEVGLGGRFDATNVLPSEVVAACGIASLGIDHERFLLTPEDGAPDDPLSRIAFEKAGIVKPGRPVATLAYPEGPRVQIEQAALAAGAPLRMRGDAWDFELTELGLTYHDRRGDLTTAIPSLSGAHQAANAGLAIAMLRHQDFIDVSPNSIVEGVCDARWPARLQRLAAGPLTALAPHRTMILDGAHNAAATQALAEAMAPCAPFDLIFGLLGNRRIDEVLAPLAPLVRKIYVVPVPGHDSHDPRTVAEWAQANFFRPVYPAADVAQAVTWLSGDPDAPETLLIAGSLYLAGEVLRLNGEIPD